MRREHCDICRVHRGSAKKVLTAVFMSCLRHRRVRALPLEAQLIAHQGLTSHLFIISTDTGPLQ